MSDDTLIIPAKYRGPPTSGNGGYVAGVIAAALTGGEHAFANNRAVEVTLRAPIPLDVPMMVRRAKKSLTVVRDEKLIAEASIQPLRIDIPTPVGWDEAFNARAHSYSLPVAWHPMFNAVRRGVHPICFCCGAELKEDDGLHVYSAPVDNNGQVAAAWIAREIFADARGHVRPEFIWTALDCPGQMAWRARGAQTGMLGRLSARIERAVRAGERCVVSGWTMGNERKKYFAGTALRNEAGELCAYAKAVWIGRVNEPATSDSAR